MIQTREAPWYKWYVLFLMTIIYAFSFVDRQIVTILAPKLKEVFSITDAQLGLLYGTTFALFYGLFGIPLARLSDNWSRKKTLIVGLSFWSLMTAMSGFAKSFSHLGLARLGVGVGEGTCCPSSISLLGDYFERDRRGFVLALYSVGIYIGAGASLMLGGTIMGSWDSAYTVSAAPFGLAGWQVTFMVVGLPGLLLAAVVALTIREPVRGRLEIRGGQSEVGHTSENPFLESLRELGSMVPPWSLLRLRALGADRSQYVANVCLLLLALVLAAVATTGTNYMLSPSRNAPIASIAGFPITSNLVQWLAMATAFYACGSWYQGVKIKDPAVHKLILGSKTFLSMVLGYAMLAFAMNGLNGFVFVYASKELGFGAERGLQLGVIAIVTGGIGIAVSGYLCDVAKKIHHSGRIYLSCITATLFTLISVIQYMTQSEFVFYIAYGAATFFLPMWFAPSQATAQDLVIPRLRGLAYAVLSLGPNVIGLGLGPYFVGLVSDATGSLRLAIMLALGTLPIALGLLLYAARNLRRDEDAALRYA